MIYLCLKNSIKTKADKFNRFKYDSVMAWHGSQTHRLNITTHILNYECFSNQFLCREPDELVALIALAGGP